MRRKLKHQALKIFTASHRTFKRHLNLAIYYSTNQENDCFIMTADFINCTIVLFVMIKYNLNLYLYKTQ